MRTFVGAVPLSAVALALVALVSVMLGPAVSRWLRTRRWVATLLLLGFGLVISATLMPTSDAMAGRVSDGVCDFSRIGPASITELTRVSLASLNVVLFVPLGIAVGLLPRTRPALAVTILAVALTFIVEVIQLLLPVLGRGCETADLFDNLLGLAIGAGIGVVARVSLGVAKPPRP